MCLVVIRKDRPPPYIPFISYIFSVLIRITTSDWLVTDKQEKLVQWQAYFETPLNRCLVPPPATLHDTVICGVRAELLMAGGVCQLHQC